MSEPLTEPGYGPPRGSSSDSPHAGPGVPLDELARRAQTRYGTVSVRGDDPAFMPPHDPLLQGNVGERTSLVYRDIPLVTVQNTWTVQGARNALYSHMAGIFDISGQLCDSILGDDRVIATLGSLSSGLFGREVCFEPADDSMAAREVCDAWERHWPRFAGNSHLEELDAYDVLMGFVPAQLVWDPTDPSGLLLPYLRPWHNRFTYFDWDLRRFIALTMDGNMPITPGDGKWFLLGGYRSWIFGRLRAVTEPWLLRHFAFRDMARFSEVHGIPIRKAWTPSVADAGERSNFKAQLAQLGAETTLLLAKGIDGQNGDGYDLDLLEAKDTAWEVFPGLIDRADMAIVLAIMMQNLTTEVQGGSYNATTAHMDIRQGGLQHRNQRWSTGTRNQVARPFAFLNYGDANLAPKTYYDVRPREDFDANAKAWQAFSTGIETLSRAGIRFQDADAVRAFAARRFNLRNLPEFTIGDPLSAKGALGGGGFGL